MEEFKKHTASFDYLIFTYYKSDSINFGFVYEMMQSGLKHYFDLNSLEDLDYADDHIHSDVGAVLFSSQELTESQIRDILKSNRKIS